MSAMFKIEGDKALIKKLNKLGPRVARKAMRQAVSSASSVYNKEIKKLVPKDTGLLRKSIGVKRKSKGATAWAYIGSRNTISDAFNVPWRYDHLVNDGFVNQHGARAVGARYMQRGAKAAEAKAKAVMATKFRTVIEREAKKK